MEDKTDVPVEGSGPESSTPAEDVAEAAPPDTETFEEPSSPSEAPAPGHSDSSIVVASPDVAVTSEKADVAPRRFVRDRRQPSRLQYAILGNPLISVVQTLFHSLSDVYTEALQRAASTDISTS